MQAARLVVTAALVALLGVSAQCDTVSIGLDRPDARFAGRASETAARAGARIKLNEIAIPGCCSSVSSGRPALPCRVLFVALPPDADLSTVRADLAGFATKILPGEYDVAAVPPIATMGGARDDVEGGGDELSGFYPREHVRVVSVGKMRTWKIATVEYWPYCYNAASGKIRAADSTEARISYRCEQAAPANAADRSAPDAAELVANPQDAINWYWPDPSPLGAPGYAIVTTRAILSSSANLRKFADLQALRGFSVKIATEDDWGGGIGDAAAESIRRWLANNYLGLGIAYVLLVGNPDPATGDVPMKLLWPRYCCSTYRDAPSDYYYADLSGNWDLDGDGNCGEEPDDFGPGGIDRLPEVYVGRIPYYGSIADLDRVLRKTMLYESTSCGDWGRRAIMAMKPLDSVTPSYQLGQAIRGDILLPSGLEARRIYDSDYGLDPPPERYPCDCQTVQDEWTTGAGFVCWMAHGGNQSAGGVFTRSQCDYLDETRQAFVYQGSCSNGSPEDPENLAYGLLRTGAIATLAASRAAWYYIGETSFRTSDSAGGIAYQYADLLLRRRQTCGRAALEARLRVPMCIWPNQLVFNLYGDPSASLDQPAPGAVSGFVSTVEGEPIAGAVVRSADGAAWTLAQSDGSYLLHGLGEGTRDVIVSAQGFYPQRFYDVPVTKGEATRLDVRLAAAASGSLAGHVYDIYGLPVPEATITAGGEDYKVESLADGSYLIGNLSPGVYTLTASKYPYAEEMVPDCAVAEGASTELDIVLRSRTGNAIANGGFEEGFNDGLAAEWQLYASPGYAGGAEAGSGARKYGAYSQKLVLPETGDEAYVGISQCASVLPGRAYTIIAWQRDHVDANGADASENVVCRVGYDPTGGADHLSPTVVWRTFDPATNVWHALFNEVVPYAPTITVFLEARRSSPGGGACCAWFDGVGLMGPITAPSVPSVRVAARYQNDGSSVSAEWSCPDSDVAGYEWAVSAGLNESGIVPGGGWIDAGLATSGTRGGLALANGELVRVLVRARNKAGATSEVGASEPIRIVADAAGIAEAKWLPDGAWVRITGVCVSRMGSGPELFVQEFNRTAGMKVEGGWAGIPYVQPGTRVSVVGRLAVRDSIRALVDAEVLPSIVVSAPRPLGMRNCWVCGNCADNSGLLVMVTGRVTGAWPDGFAIDDGTLRGGLVIRCVNPAAGPEVGRLVRVEGISTPRGVLVCSPGDVVELD